MRPAMYGLLVLAACNVRISGAPSDEISDAPTVDGASDARVAPPDAFMFGPWQPAAKISSASTTAIEDDETLSSNALEMIFAIDASNGNGTGKDLYYTSRSSLAGPWSMAAKVPFDSATTSDESPRFSADDKTLYFATGRAGNGNLDIYMINRTTVGTNNTWGTAKPVSSVNTTTLTEKWFSTCGANQDHYVMVQSTSDGTTDLFEGTLGGAAAKPITDLNSPQNDTSAFITQDCLTIYFASTRVTPGAIFRAQRAAIGSPWSSPAKVDDFSVVPGGNQEDPWLSPDGHIFTFVSDAAGNKDVYISTR